MVLPAQQKKSCLAEVRGRGGEGAFLSASTRPLQMENTPRLPAAVGREESFRPRSSPRCPAPPITIVRRPEQEPPQGHQRQQDAQENEDIDEFHAPIMKSAPKPSSGRPKTARYPCNPFHPWFINARRASCVFAAATPVPASGRRIGHGSSSENHRRSAENPFLASQKTLILKILSEHKSMYGKDLRPDFLKST